MFKSKVCPFKQHSVSQVTRTDTVSIVHAGQNQASLMYMRHTHLVVNGRPPTQPEIVEQTDVMSEAKHYNVVCCVPMHIPKHFSTSMALTFGLC